ncbi:hypothetical protein AGMMS50225_28650 [Betaproteobacteria bacterium]|nr:hypothetical protein AGMMS50225_28650 [Betaproteobacteria bacterium]GHU22428.1 hypothetical protein AGMMS50243_21970 [Betaproteobacteria bacterium]
MKATLKEMYSLELSGSLDEFWPNDEEYFGIPIRLMIGTEDSSSSDSFDIFVCTPSWIANQMDSDKYVWGRHMLIVNEYDLSVIKQAIERYIAACTGKDWLTIARKLSGMGAWEFEEYEP